MKQQMKGFSLVELMVVMAIVSILMTIAVPGYRDYMMRANRVDAKAAMLRLVANQEKFYLQNNSYATDAQLAAAPPNGLGFDSTERGYYDIAMAAAGGGWAQGFTLTATAAAGSGQADDDDCQTFTLNDRGQRTARDSGGADSTETCWR